MPGSSGIISASGRSPGPSRIWPGRGKRRRRSRMTPAGCDWRQTPSCMLQPMTSTAFGVSLSQSENGTSSVITGMPAAARRCQNGVTPHQDGETARSSRASGSHCMRLWMPCSAMPLIVKNDGQTEPGKRSAGDTVAPQRPSARRRFRLGSEPSAHQRSSRCGGRESQATSSSRGASTSGVMASCIGAEVAGSMLCSASVSPQCLRRS
jgi:hypothetical protein